MLSTIKTVGTVAIIIGCFAVLYPKFLHPLFLRTFGLQKASKNEDPTYPPHFTREGPPPRDKRPPPMPVDPKEARHHGRPGPHPGLRAAAEMQKHQSQGSGRGMMGFILPMYAIGICVYLVYTLCKVFNKRSQYGDSSGKSQFTAENEQNLDKMGFPQNMVGGQDEEEVQQFLWHKRQEKELEELMLKMEDQNVGEDEMRVLQKRLEDTEAQMTRILQAMQNMQSRMATMAQPSFSHASKETKQSSEVASVGNIDGSQIKEEITREDQSKEETLDDTSMESSTDTEFGKIKTESSSIEELQVESLRSSSIEELELDSLRSSPIEELQVENLSSQFMEDEEKKESEVDPKEINDDEIVMDLVEKLDKEESSVRNRKIGMIGDN